MPNNNYNPRSDYNQGLIRGLSTQIFRSSDIGCLLRTGTSNSVNFAGAATSVNTYVGYLAAVVSPHSALTVNSFDNPTNHYANLFYYRKFDRSVEIEASYDVLDGHYATSDIGYYTGLSTRNAKMSRANIAAAPSSAGLGRWLRITGFSTDRHKVYGFPVGGMINTNV